MIILYNVLLIRSHLDLICTVAGDLAILVKYFRIFRQTVDERNRINEKSCACILLAGEDFGVPVLTIIGVDPCIAENGGNHRTFRYDLMARQDDKSRLVVRRGQEFYLHLTLSRDYEPRIDGMSIVFTVDGVERPQYGHGTLVAIPVLYPGEPSEGSWQATIDAIQPNFIRLKVSDRRRAVFRSISIHATM